MTAEKSMAGALVVAVLLGAGGEVFRRTAAFEDALSAAQERMATQRPGGALISEDAERDVRWTRSLPVVGALVNALSMQEEANALEHLVASLTAATQREAY